jgi:hypothetical protein
MTPVLILCLYQFSEPEQREGTKSLVRSTVDRRTTFIDHHLRVIFNPS